MALDTSQKQARLLVVGLALALVSYSAGRVIAWSQATPLPGAEIVEMSEAQHMRRSTGRRHELVVLHEGQEHTGRMTTYWWLGTPHEGERVDLRISQESPHRELHFDSWLREFGSSLAFVLAAGLLGGLAWRRWGHMAGDDRT